MLHLWLNRKLIDLLFSYKFLIGVLFILLYSQPIWLLQFHTLFTSFKTNVLLSLLISFWHRYLLFVVVVLNVNIQSSAFCLTSRFHSILKYCGILVFGDLFFCDIAIFAKLSCGVREGCKGLLETEKTHKKSPKTAKLQEISSKAENRNKIPH